MNFFKKNIDIICVVILSIWINFFPSTDDSPRELQVGRRERTYNMLNVNSPQYDFYRWIVPVGGAIGCIVIRMRRKKKDDE